MPRGIFGLSRLLLLPGVALDGGATLVYDDALGSRSRINPNHRHRPFALVDEIMDTPARDERCRAVSQLITAPFHDANGSSLDDANRLVEIVEVRRQPAPRLKQTVAAAHFDSRHQALVEMVDEAGPGACLEPAGCFETRHSFLPRARRPGFRRFRAGGLF